MANPSLDFCVLSSTHLTVMLYFHTVDYIGTTFPSIIYGIANSQSYSTYGFVKINQHLSQFCCDSIVRAWLPCSYLHKDVALGGQPRRTT